jgi:hypothetical protein
MRRTIFALICGSLLLSFAACSKSEQANKNASSNASNSASPATATKTPPANIVIAGATPVQITPGGAAEAVVLVNISDGYHINANPASAKFLIATTLEVEKGEGIRPGEPQYPPSVTKKFPFSPDPLAVYEGEATIKVQLKAATDTRKGEHTLRAKLRVQPCDDQTCYPPRDIETSIPVNVN